VPVAFATEKQRREELNKGIVEGTIRRVALEVSFPVSRRPRVSAPVPRAQYAARLLLLTSACRCKQDRTCRHHRRRSRSSRIPLWASGIRIGKLPLRRICTNIVLS